MMKTDYDRISELLNENLGFEKDLIDSLNSYKIGRPPADKINSLVSELYSYVPQKSLKPKTEHMNQLFYCARQVMKEMPLYCFLIAFLICAFGIIISSQTFGYGTTVVSILLPPLPIAVSMLVFGNRRDRNMAEFLMTCLYDYRQLMVARLFVAAVYSVCADAVFMLYMVLSGRFAPAQNLIFCLSLALSLSAALQFIRRISGAQGAAAILFCWIGASALCSLQAVRPLLERPHPAVVLPLAALAFLLSFRQIVKIPEALEKKLLAGRFFN
jgi:hypothetical protein